RFNQPVDPVSAANPANYFINGAPAIAARVYVAPTDLRDVVLDGSRVVVTPGAPFTGNFTVTVTNVLDLSGNAVAVASNSASGTAAGLAGVDVNPYFT